MPRKKCDVAEVHPRSPVRMPHTEHAPVTREMCRIMWESGRLSMREVSIVSHVPEKTLWNWRKAEKWKTGAELQAEMADHVRESVQALRLEQAIPRYKRALERTEQTSDMVQEVKDQFLEDGVFLGIDKNGDAIYGKSPSAMEKIVRSELAVDKRLDELYGTDQIINKPKDASEERPLVNINFLTSGQKL